MSLADSSHELGRRVSRPSAADGLGPSGKVADRRADSRVRLGVGPLVECTESPKLRGLVRVFPVDASRVPGVASVAPVASGNSLAALVAGEGQAVLGVKCHAHHGSRAQVRNASRLSRSHVDIAATRSKRGQSLSGSTVDGVFQTLRTNTAASASPWLARCDQSHYCFGSNGRTPGFPRRMWRLSASSASCSALGWGLTRMATESASHAQGALRLSVPDSLDECGIRQPRGLQLGGRRWALLVSALLSLSSDPIAFGEDFYLTAHRVLCGRVQGEQAVLRTGVESLVIRICLDRR